MSPDNDKDNVKIHTMATADKEDTGSFIKDELITGLKLVGNNSNQSLAMQVRDMVNKHGLYNISLEFIMDLIMSEGIIHVGTGEGYGEMKALVAVREAVKNMWLERSLDYATHIVIRVTGDISLGDLNDALAYLANEAGDRFDIVVGGEYDSDKKDYCAVTVVASFRAVPVPDI